ncbi:hypothetical protein D3C76_214140 [compost metagenome]
MKAHVADWRARSYCLRIVPESGPVVRLTDQPTDLVMSNGQVYASEAGYEFSGYGSTSSMSPSSIDLTGILDHGVSRDQLASGVYDNARVYLFATSWAAPVEDEEALALLILGKTTLYDDRYTAQLMSLVDALNQTVGRQYTAQCPWTLFDQTLDGVIIASTRSRCTGPRVAPDGPNINAYKVTGTVTAVTDLYQFQDSARAEVDDWFTNGAVMFITGANAGLKPKEIKDYTAGGQVIVYEAFHYPIQVGDQYVMIPGCRKRRDEDCVAKYANGANFGGQPDVPAPSQYGQIGRGG